MIFERANSGGNKKISDHQRLRVGGNGRKRGVEDFTFFMLVTWWLCDIIYVSKHIKMDLTE